MGKASRRKHDKAQRNIDYNEFMGNITRLRKEVVQYSFTDRSQIDSYFLPFYEKLLAIDSPKHKPSVTEYGGGVASVSLYLAARGVIEKIIVIDKNNLELQEVEHIKQKLR